MLCTCVSLLTCLLCVINTAVWCRNLSLLTTLLLTAMSTLLPPTLSGRLLPTFSRSVLCQSVMWCVDCNVCVVTMHTSVQCSRSVCARERCRISPPRFLAECHKRRLNQASFVLLCFALFAFIWIVFSLCIVFIFVCCPVFSSVNQRDWHCIC